MTDGDAELDSKLDVLEQAGLVETYVNDEGNDAMRLTSNGERVARQMAMSSKDEQDALLAGLVEAAEEDE